MSEPPVGAPYKDRSTGMLLFGLLELLIALGCLAMLGLATFGLAAASVAPAGTSSAEARAMLPGLMVYLLLAALFATLGVGSILPRRWARTLSLVVSWFWLLVGIASMLIAVFLLPPLLDRLAQVEGGAGGAEAAAFAKGCVLVFFALFFILLPGLLVAFYRGPNVRATFEARDPVTRWTDRCPTPVLGLSLFLAYAAFGSLTAAMLGTLPLFGRMLSGAPAILLMVVLGAMLAVLSRAVYKLEPWAWWGVAAFWLLWTLSGAALAAGGLDMRSMYRQMQVPAEQIAQMEQMGIFDLLQGPVVKVAVVAWGLVSLAFLLYVRRHFHRAEAPASPQ